MSNPKIYTFNPKNKTTQFEFYILCKGLNSGKPLEKPCPNSFVISCSTQVQKDFYYTLIFGMFKSNQFYHLHTGSVIPFIRINEFKNEVFKHKESVFEVQDKFTKTVEQIKLLEEKEKQFKQNLLLLADLKRALLHQYFRR